MTDPPIGLITAIPQELDHFSVGFEETGRVERAGLLFREGALDGHPLVVVEAGLGKVNAALVAGLLCERFDCRALVFSGVAGGLDPALEVGDLVIGRRVVCHDYGLLSGERIIPYQPGSVPLPGQATEHGYHLPPHLIERFESAVAGLELPALSATATGRSAGRQPRIVFGTILTGDTFLNCVATRERLHRDFGGQAVEMEGAAIAQVASRYNVPFVVVRALSDLAGAESHMDFGVFVSEAAGLAASVVRRLIPELSASESDVHLVP